MEHKSITDFIFCFRGVNLRLTNTAAGIWRLQSEIDGHFDDMGAAQTLCADIGEEFEGVCSNLTVSDDKNIKTIKGGDGSFVAVSDDFIKFYANGGKLKRTLTGIKTKKDLTEISLSLSKDERIYGTGERFNRVNQFGKHINMYAIDRWCQKEGNSYIPVPFIISSNLSALFFNRYEPSVLDIGFFGRNSITLKQKLAPIDMYVFTTDSPADILTGYCRLTGFAPLPASWAFGTLVCRYHPEFSSKEGIYAMAQAMKDNDFPWEAVITEGYGAYKTEKRDDLREVSRTLHSDGKKVMVYEQCGRFPSNAENGFGLTDEFAVQSDEGTALKETSSLNLLDNFHRKKMRCVDITSEKALKKWKEVWDELLNGIGVDGAKIDFCEQFPDKPSIHFQDGRNPAAAHHWYPTFYNILRYKHFNTRPDGGINFSRGGGIGIQRAPFVWAGDQRREYHFLKAVERAALSCGLSGIPFVSWDMAGYQPAWLLYDRKHEDGVFLRGIEFTAFSPTIQTHGRVKRPYDFDEHTKNVYRAYAKLHDEMRPYLIEQAEISCKTGVPLMRHLFLYDPADPRCLDCEDEYMLGDGLLIAPVFDRKCKRNIYLPKGKWINIFTKEEYNGGTALKNYKVSREMIPVFKLKNSPSKTLDRVLEKSEKLIAEINSF